MVYYGLSLGVNLIGGDIFFNSFLSGAIEIPSYIIVIPIMNKIGRRWTTVGSLVAASLSCFACIFLFDKPGLCPTLLCIHRCQSPCNRAGNPAICLLPRVVAIEVLGSAFFWIFYTHPTPRIANNVSNAEIV